MARPTHDSAVASAAAGVGDDPFLSLIAGLGEGPPSSDFYGRICEVICKAVDLDRAVVFQYDTELRRVRPLGGFGIDAAQAFGEVWVSPDTAKFVREALEHDAVVEIGGPDLDAETPPVFKALIEGEGRRAVCVPVSSSGRWLGLLLADRSDAAPVLTPRERELLLGLGKALALATMARRVTRRDERERMLRQRVEMARQVHDGVIQRLFGVSLALAGEGPLSAEDRARCASEIESAMEQLRDTVARRTELDEPPPKESLGELLQLWRGANDDIELRFSADEVALVPAQLDPVVRSTLIEALRNARKHAEPRVIDVRVAREDDTLVVEIVNDGVLTQAARDESSSQMGLRILGIEALQAGGVLEFGARPAATWSMRLLVPLGHA